MAGVFDVKVVTSFGTGSGKIFRQLKTEFARTRKNLDHQHAQIFKDLKDVGNRIMHENILRPQESGIRSDQRDTGKLFGARNVVQGRENGKGGARVVGKGISWPRTDILNRQAPSWRALEFGLDAVTMPAGLFVNEGGGDVFRLFRERENEFLTNVRRKERGRGDAIPRGKYGPIRAKRVFERTWDEVIGLDKQQAADNLWTYYSRVFKSHFKAFNVRFR